MLIPSSRAISSIFSGSARGGAQSPAGCVGCLWTVRDDRAAEQTEEGETTRNDRLVAVPDNSRVHRHVQQLQDLNENLVAEIEHFFVSYNEVRGKQFKPVGRGGVERAREIVNEAQRRLARESQESGTG